MPKNNELIECPRCHGRTAKYCALCRGHNGLSAERYAAYNLLLDDDKPHVIQYVNVLNQIDAQYPIEDLRYYSHWDEDIKLNGK